MKYRKKPVVIEAIQWSGTNSKDCKIFCDKLIYNDPAKFPIIQTLEGDMQVGVGDYIIKGVKGEFYPCKPDIFEMTYEKC